LQRGSPRWRRHDSADPGRAVARITPDLMCHGKHRDLAEDIWEITPETVARAVHALGELRIFRLGSDLGSRCSR